MCFPTDLYFLLHLHAPNLSPNLKQISLQLLSNLTSNMIPNMEVRTMRNTTLMGKQASTQGYIANRS